MRPFSKSSGMGTLKRGPKKSTNQENPLGDHPSIADKKSTNKFYSAVPALFCGKGSVKEFPSMSSQIRHNALRPSSIFADSHREATRFLTLSKEDQAKQRKNQLNIEVLEARKSALSRGVRVHPEPAQARGGTTKKRQRPSSKPAAKSKTKDKQTKVKTIKSRKGLRST